MSESLPDPPLPRDKEQILRDFSVARQLKDIRDQAQLKDQLAPKWWEAGIGILQFAAALGLLASLVQYPPLRALALGRFMVFWAVMLVLSLILGIEFLILRIHHLRRAFELNLRLIDSLGQRLEALESEHGREGEPDEPRPEKRPVNI